ncbi:MAG: hypothetical protein FWG87_13485 [Defluviitaleaceae bacterium]|nr:hypothetical protein [Defluviitaleaceae bacterium]
MARGKIAQRELGTADNITRIQKLLGHGFNGFSRIWRIGSWENPTDKAV